MAILELGISAFNTSITIVNHVLHTGSKFVGTVLLQLLKTTSIIEEAPADQVVATASLTAELLGTLHIGNLLKELILRSEV